VSALGLALRGAAAPVVRRDAVEPGVTAVAAPVRGPAGDIVAALSVTGPTYRLDAAAVAAAAAAVEPAAAALSHALGAPG
jgi:DNA-binding IclR family transcriptional regulator